MLILSRRPGEPIKIGHDITVNVVGIQGLQVRLGIDAPEGVSVHRQEVYDRIQAERAAAGPAHIDDRIKKAVAEADPRNAFVRLNPGGFRPDDLQFSAVGFADEYAQRSYEVFLSGYQAGLEIAPCES